MKWIPWECVPQGVEFYDFIWQCVCCVEFSVGVVLLHGQGGSMFLKLFVNGKAKTYERNDV